MFYIIIILFLRLIFKTSLSSLRLRSQLRESYSELREHLNAKTVRGPNPGFWRICGRIEAIYSHVFVCIRYKYIYVLYIWLRLKM